MSDPAPAAAAPIPESRYHSRSQRIAANIVTASEPVAPSRTYILPHTLRWPDPPFKHRLTEPTLIAASLPREFVHIISSLSCNNCKRRFTTSIPPFSPPCSHLYCEECCVQITVPKPDGSRYPSFHCVVCQQNLDETASDLDYFMPHTNLIEAIRILEETPGYRCEHCQVLDPALNVVECRACAEKKASEPEEKRPRLDDPTTTESKPSTSPAGPAPSGSSLVVPSPAGSRHSSSPESGPGRAVRVGTQEPVPSCSKASDEKVEEMARVHKKPQSAKPTGPAPFLSCVWCARHNHATCKLRNLDPATIEPSPRVATERIGSFDSTHLPAWSLVNCALCWQQFLKNGDRANLGMFSQKPAGTALTEGAISLKCMHFMCFDDPCYRRKRKEGSNELYCQFCEKDVIYDAAPFRSMDHLNRLLEHMQEVRQCAFCEDFHPVSNLSSVPERTGITRCVWCDLHYVQFFLHTVNDPRGRLLV